jgi:hypothetical protein
MIEGFVGVILFVVVIAFWAFVLYILWHILQALQGIERGIDDVAKTLRDQKSI